MHAYVGDILVVEGNTVGQPERRATILQVLSADGTPPYRVRWDDGHEALIYPGFDAHVAHPTAQPDRP